MNKAGSNPFATVDEGPKPSDATVFPEDAPETATVPHPSVEALLGHFGEAILAHEVCAGDQHVVYVDRARNVEILAWLKAEPDQHYDHLADLTAVDYGGGRPIQVVYQLWSIHHKRALRVKAELPLTELEIESATGLWRCADWLEREVYDMFGVVFAGHPDPRRILMPENYAEGYPLRKDFPLRGRFSRAEQTRRALTQNPVDDYSRAEMGDREPQLVESVAGDEGDESEEVNRGD